MLGLTHLSFLPRKNLPRLSPAILLLANRTADWNGALHIFYLQVPDLIL
jgi:hypothetical protein